MNIRSITLVLLSICYLNNLQAQLFGDTKDEIQDFCWKSEDPNVNLSEVPEKWKGNSAAILYHGSFYYFARKGQSKLSIHSLDHYRIKIQDEAALTDFSELYFTDDGSTAMNTYEVVNHRGIKLVKADGKEEIIDMKKEVVVEEDERKKKKMAIPNLEIGDIIDYYVYSKESGYTNYNYHFQVIEKSTLASSYPMLYALKHLDYASGSWNLFYHTGNGAPEFATTTDKGRKQTTFEVKNIAPIKDDRWNFEYQSYPYYKFYIRLQVLSRGPAGALTADKIADDYRSYYVKSPQAKNEYNKFKSYLKKKELTDISDKEKLEAYYYFLRHLFKNMHLVYDEFNNNKDRDVAPKTFTGHLLHAVQEMDLKYQLLVITPRQAGNIEDVIVIGETFYIVRVQLDGEAIYFYHPDRHTMFNQVPATIEGSEVYALESGGVRGGVLDWEKETLSVSSHEKNVTVYENKISLAENLIDPILLEGRVTTKGLSNVYFKDQMLNVFDFVLDENIDYGTKRWGDIEKEKGAFKEKLIRMRDDHIKYRNEYWKEYLEDDYLGEVELEELKIEKTGNSFRNHDFIFNYKANIADLVKKAGPNYILAAGQLVGGQVDLKEEEKERSVDVHMYNARSFDYVVEVEIPEGYTVEGIENFNKNVDNETGTLRSTGKVEGNKIILTLYKAYKHNFEKAEDWPKMVEFLDAAYQFTQEKLLLKKG